MNIFSFWPATARLRNKRLQMAQTKLESATYWRDFYRRTYLCRGRANPLWSEQTRVLMLGKYVEYVERAAMWQERVDRMTK